MQIRRRKSCYSCRERYLNSSDSCFIGGDKWWNVVRGAIGGKKQGRRNGCLLVSSPFEVAPRTCCELEMIGHNWKFGRLEFSWFDAEFCCFGAQEKSEIIWLARKSWARSQYFLDANFIIDCFSRKKRIWRLSEYLLCVARAAVIASPYDFIAKLYENKCLVSRSLRDKLIIISTNVRRPSPLLPAPQHKTFISLLYKIISFCASCSAANQVPATPSGIASNGLSDHRTSRTIAAGQFPFGGLRLQLHQTFHSSHKWPQPGSQKSAQCRSRDS